MKIILGQRLFDYEEVAKMLGVGVSSIRKYVSGRGLSTTTIERRKYLSEEEIKKMIAPSQRTDRK